MGKPVCVIVPDKFKGSATAADIAKAMAAGARRAGWEFRIRAMADGGEGTLDALGGPNAISTVRAANGGEVAAGWRLDEGGLAVIEIAAAAGLQQAGGRTGNDPVHATTVGVGDLIAEALEAGAIRVVVGLGGSATTDGGWGAVEVLESYAPLAGPDAGYAVVVAHDVFTSFTDAAAVFGPQKGASPDQVRILTRRLVGLQELYLAQYGVDLSQLPGAGAAGGLAGGLVALGAELVPGFDVVADVVHLREAMAGANLVITGEGLLDAESFNGKVVGGVAGMAHTAGHPVLVVAGESTVERRESMEVVSLVERFGVERSWNATLACVQDVVTEHLRGIEIGRPRP